MSGPKFMGKSKARIKVSYASKMNLRVARLDGEVGTISGPVTSVSGYLYDITVNGQTFTINERDLESA